MRKFKKALAYGLTFVIFGSLSASNQTSSLSPIFSGYDLPYRVQIEEANFDLPNGVHSYSFAQYDGKWLLVGGRTNGMHGFNADDNNFPPQEQNTTFYVVNPASGTVYTRSMSDPTSGLTQTQIDSLAVTSPQNYQSGSTLYMTGGYGVVTSTGQFSTKDTLSAIDVPGLMNWVVNAPMGDSAAQHIRQISDPTFQVTGGYMSKIGNNPTLLVFGQDFSGFYHDESNGNYTQQVRRFNINDDGTNLSATILPPDPVIPDPAYRRRDLNVCPIISNENGQLEQGLVALSGVFTLSTGIWTVPVHIDADGSTFMPNSSAPGTFKQGMNVYTNAFLGMYSEDTDHMYNVLMGGITYEYFQNGQYLVDSEFPFTNQVTTVSIDENGKFKQYLQQTEYPVILSEFSNPGNPLLFGAGAWFLLPNNGPFYSNGVLKLDEIGPDPFLAGYVVGGIQSTVPNTSTMSDSAASPYVFNVIVTPVPILSGCQVYNVTGNKMGSKAGALILDCATIKTLNSINSPTQLTIRSGGGTFDTNGFDSTLSGVIWGPGPFKKIGNGMLTLTADSSGYKGTTTIESGILKLAEGSKLGGILNVERDNLLVGTGTAGIQVNNRGIVSPGTPQVPGTMYVNGNYTQFSEGVLVFEFDKNSGSTLQVAGLADIAGLLTVYNPTNYLPPIGTIYTPLFAGAVNGTFYHTFTNITPTVLLRPEYFSNGLWLKVQRDYINPTLVPDLNHDQISVGEMLNRVTDTAGPDLNSVLSAIDSLQTNKQVADAYDQIMPRTTIIESEIAFAQATLQVRNLIKRMEQIERRCNFKGSSSSCGWFDGLGMFLTGTGLFTEQRETACQIPYTSQTYAVTGGLDYYFGNDLFVGIYLGYGKTNTQLDNHGGKLYINAWQSGIYSSWDWGCFSFEGLFGYGWNNYEIERNIRFSYVDRTAKADPDGHEYIAYGSVGYDLDRNNWILEPLVSLQYVSVNVDSYEEREADSLDLKIGSQSVSSFQAAVGASLHYPIRISFARIMPSFRAFFVHEFFEGCRTVNASLAKTPNSKFTIHNGKQGQDFGLLGFGLTVLLNEHAMVYLDYDAEVGRSHYKAQAFQGGFRYEF